MSFFFPKSSLPPVPVLCNMLTHSLYLLSSLFLSSASWFCRPIFIPPLSIFSHSLSLCWSHCFWIFLLMTACFSLLLSPHPLLQLLFSWMSTWSLKQSHDLIVGSAVPLPPPKSKDENDGNGADDDGVWDAAVITSTVAIFTGNQKHPVLSRQLCMCTHISVCTYPLHPSASGLQHLICTATALMLL